MNTKQHFVCISCFLLTVSAKIPLSFAGGFGVRIHRTRTFCSVGVLASSVQVGTECLLFPVVYSRLHLLIVLYFTIRYFTPPACRSVFSIGISYRLPFSDVVFSSNVFFSTFFRKCFSNNIFYSPPAFSFDFSSGVFYIPSPSSFVFYNNLLQSPLAYNFVFSTNLS